MRDRFLILAEEEMRAGALPPHPDRPGSGQGQPTARLRWSLHWVLVFVPHPLVLADGFIFQSVPMAD